MNAPEPGTIKEFLVNEEDTVTVGQDLLKLELGGTPAGVGKQEGGQEPKAPAPDEQSTSSDPEPKKDEGKLSEAPTPPPPEEAPQPRKEAEPKEEEPKQRPTSKKEPPSQEQSNKPQESKIPMQTAANGDLPYGSREERRVIFLYQRL